MIREWTGQNTSGFTVFSRQQARQFDDWAIHTAGMPSLVLMENAARGVVEALVDVLRYEIQNVLIFCGGGNNGGDGLAIARWFHTLDIESHIFLTAHPDMFSADMAAQYALCRKIGLDMRLMDLQHLENNKVKSLLRSDTVVLDALFGTGLSRPLSEPYVGLIEFINALPAPKIAVDVPSGLDCDTGQPLPVSIEAQVTVTFAALKRGFVENPDSRRYLGRVFVAPLGIRPSSFGC